MIGETLDNLEVEDDRDGEGAALVTFDSFQPGFVMGRVRERVDHDMLRQCGAIYGGSDAASGLSGPELTTIFSMRAYLKVVAPRPPGNIHLRERVAIDDLPGPGEEIDTEVSCVSKELRAERRRVVLATRTHGRDGRALFSTEMTLLWAR
jgi:hypothetical protein